MLYFIWALLAKGRDQAEGAMFRNGSHPLFFCLVAGLSLIFAGPLIALYQVADSGSEFTHILIIPAIVAYLFFTERNRFFSYTKVSPFAGNLLVGAGAAMALIAVVFQLRLDSVAGLDAWVISFVFFVMGAFRLTYGPTAFRRSLFPLLFLFVMVPFPPPILDRVIYTLQWGSAEVTHWLFRLIGVPVFRQEFIFFLPGLAIEVAEECSGIRSSMALAITGLLAAYLFLSKWWTRGALLSTILPLAVFKNGVRIGSLCLLSLYVDESFIKGDLHSRGGVVFFCFSLVILGGILWALRMAEGHRSMNPWRWWVRRQETGDSSQ